MCCRTADLLNCAMLGWRKYCCSTFVPSASPDEVTDVDRDKEAGCGEQGKRWGGERRARCWEVQVTWWAPGPCGGGCTLPLSYIYPLAAARQAVWVDGGRCGEDAGVPMGMREKVSELEREMLRWILMSDQSWAERRGDILLPAAHQHASVSRVKYCDLWLFPLSPFINVIQIEGTAAWHAHTSAERISQTRWRDSAGVLTEPFVSSVLLLYITSLQL